MPLAGSSTLQECSVGSEPNAVPLSPSQYEGAEVSVKNTFIEVGPKQTAPFKRSVTVTNASSSSSSDDPYYPNPEKLQLPLNLSEAIDAAEVPVTPSMGMLGQSPMNAYFSPDPRRAQSPMTRWFDGTPSNQNHASGCCADSASPLARWLQGSPLRAEEIPWQKQGPFAMEPKCPESAVGQMYLAPVCQPMVLQTVPMVTSTMCTPGPTAQNAFQPTGVLVPQTMPIWPLQQKSELSFTDAATATAATAPKTAKSGVLESMAAWRSQQSSMDGTKVFSADRNAPWIAKNLKEPKSQFSMSNQKSVRPRGKNDNSRKQADTSDSVASGPRAVFVDLSKIVPTKSQ